MRSPIRCRFADSCASAASGTKSTQGRGRSGEPPFPTSCAPAAKVIADRDQHDPYDSTHGLLPPESLGLAQPERIGQDREQENSNSQDQDCPVPPRCHARPPPVTAAAAASTS